MIMVCRFRGLPGIQAVISQMDALPGHPILIGELRRNGVRLTGRHDPRPSDPGHPLPARLAPVTADGLGALIYALRGAAEEWSQ